MSNAWHNTIFSFLSFFLYAIAFTAWVINRSLSHFKIKFSMLLCTVNNGTIGQR